MGQIVIVSLITTGLVAMCFVAHYFALRWCAKFVGRETIFARRPMLFVLGTVFMAHLCEVLLFAVAFYMMHWNADLGSIAGSAEMDRESFIDYFYFSITSYTTLGVGDLVPTGAIRIVTGIEALVGLVLIAWSASFSYLMMERLWSAEKGEL